MPRGRRSYAERAARRRYRRSRRTRAGYAIRRWWKSLRYTPRMGRRRNLMLYPNNSVTVSLRKTGEITQDTQFQTSGVVFKLNEFNSYTKFTAIFEQFRIVKIIQKIYPQCDTFLAPTNIAIVGGTDEQQVVQPSVPLLCYKIDRDDVDDGGLTNLDGVLKNPRFKVKSMKKPHTIAWKPNVLNNIYQGAVTNNYEIKFGAWMNCENSADCEHYGLVRAFHCTGASSTYPLKYRLITTAVVQFKGLRLDE